MAAHARGEERTLYVVGALLAVYLVWGSTYLAMRVAIESFPPFLMAGIRFVLAGSVMYAVLRLRGHPAPTALQWRAGAVTGLLFMVVGNGAVAVAQQWVASSLSAVMISSMPLFAALFSGLAGRWPRWVEWAGLALGLLGVAFLNLDGALRASPLGASLLVLAPAGWALGTVWSRTLPLPRGPMASATQMLSGGGVLLVLALLSGQAPGDVTARAGWALAYLVVFGSLLAFSAYGYLMRTVRPALATSYAYVNPVVAVLLGVLLGGERFTARAGVATAVILSGVVLVVTGPALLQWFRAWDASGRR